MRVAICLSGLIGFYSKFGGGKVVNYKISKKFFDKNLNQNDIKIDYFLHCWNEEFENDLIELYSPKKIMFEKPLVKNHNLNIKEYSALSNNYSKKKVVQLKSSYEKEKSITYDIVILTRFDIIILNPLNYKKIDKTKFYVVGPKKHHSNNCKCLFCDDSLPNHCLNDVLFISSSKNIDKFSLAYDYVNEYGLKSNHIITKKHLLKTGLWENVDYVYKAPDRKSVV